MPASPFKEQPLAFLESYEAEQLRLRKLKAEDPIALQDAVNTSKALVEAVKAGDLEEIRTIIENAVDGEFLQVFVLQAFVLSLKQANLAVVSEFVGWGMPLNHEQLSQALHLVCEVTTRDNFSDAWRILQLLIEGRGDGRLDVNSPRAMDGWTPLCVACAGACLPLAFKLLELNADPNVITRANDTPISLAKRAREDDNDEQREARGIITNMLRHYGGQERWQDALAKARRPKPKAVVEVSTTVQTAGGSETIVRQAVSASHTRFAA